MHSDSISPWRHGHVFLGASHVRNERRTWIVVALTAAMMVLEIIAGILFGSMALLADGFHMATHTGALAIAAGTYLYARRHAHDERFTFGTGKMGELAGFASALILAVIALVIGFESVLRLTSPIPIRFEEAIAVAALGLLVNLISAWMLHEREHRRDDDQFHHDHHHHGHREYHVHSAAPPHQDHNLRSAYFHVLTDALTSVLAIAGLLVGQVYGWLWMDPLMGIVGGILIARWSWSLMRGAGAVLLDTVPDQALSERIKQTLEEGGDRVCDLHLWRVGPGHIALIVSLVSDRPCAPSHYKAMLSRIPEVSHVTIEVLECQQARLAV